MGKQSDAVKSLSGKRALVTGSSLGIGRAVAVRLAAEGAQVVLSARHSDMLEETVKLIRDAGGEAVACAGSVADYGDAGDMVATCVDQFGGIDVLINCAGIAAAEKTLGRDGPHDQDLFTRTLDINLAGTFNNRNGIWGLVDAVGQTTVCQQLHNHPLWQLVSSVITPCNGLKTNNILIF